MRTFIKTFLFVSFTWLFATSAAQAALLGLIPDHVPDAKSWVSIDYTGDTTNGFHMDVDGFITAFDDGTGISYLSGTGTYTLDADFDGNGNFLTGTIDLDYAPTQITSDGTNLSSGDLVSGTLNNFGFGSSPYGDPAAHGNIGLFEFSYDLDSGDYGTIWGGANGGTIIDIRALLDASMNPFNTGGATWDDFVNGTGGSFMQTEFHAMLDGLTTADTFIPIPAAVWLFGSGLMAIGAVARRRRPDNRA